MINEFAGEEAGSVSSQGGGGRKQIALCMRGRGGGVERGQDASPGSSGLSRTWHWVPCVVHSRMLTEEIDKSSAATCGE